MLRQQVQAQGMEQAGWHVPVFCCDELRAKRVRVVCALTRRTVALEVPPTSPSIDCTVARAFARRQSPQAMPMFLSRKALAETWALSRVAGVVTTLGEPRLSRVGFTANFGVEGRQRPSSDARVCARW